jgi:hypothetical protein
MCRHIALSFALLCCSALVRADATFEFSVDISSVTGTSGSLDFQFNPGPLVSQAASLEILNLTTDGTFTAAPVLTGEVSGGPLPAPPVTFDNLAPFNDYFQGFTFGSSLVFDIRFFGPAVNAPDGTATSGSTFAFSMFSDAAGTVPVLTTDLTDGLAALANISLDGSISVTNFSTATTVTSVSAVPEPASLALIGSALAVLSAFPWRKQPNGMD